MSLDISKDTELESASKTFSTSMVISGIRCTLTYVVFPWLLPLVGVASGITAGLGLPIGLVAIFFNLLSIRRFWKSDHNLRWVVATVNLSVIILLSILVATDISELLS
ncbi:uncharacterized protein METZ01_LOCUS398610 [marine metagenome]|uniref:Uncharacterized protein n=1 Tax=marine metagenome TaxID=408172 RepID=A0A382VGU8_9ZZZZ